MDVAVEHQSDDAPFAVDHRAARVAADDVVVARQIEAGTQVQAATHRRPAVGYAERILIGGALEQRRQHGERLDPAAFLLPALYRAEVQPQREGGIRRNAGAVDLETRVRDLLRAGRLGT